MFLINKAFKYLWIIYIFCENYDIVVKNSIARSAKHQYLSYSEGDFEFFGPHGQHIALIGVKFGKVLGVVVHSSAPNFTPLMQR